MKRKSRIRLVVLGSAMALVAATFLVVLPALGTPSPDADHLRLTGATKAFFYGSNDPATATDIQYVELGKGCLIAHPDRSGSGDVGSQLVELSATGKGPGYVDYGIGVKSGGSNGTPCSQVDGSEKLIITSKNSWIKLRLDVEVKGGVTVVVEMWNGGSTPVATHKLMTGSTSGSGPPPYQATTTGAGGPTTSAGCAFPTDSGPDANIKDNCQWSLEPGVSFNQVVIYPKDGVGSVSLEGGNDYQAYNPSGFAAGAYDSLFYRAMQANDDSYEMDERSDETTANTLSGNVLDNDVGATGAANPSVLQCDQSGNCGTVDPFSSTGSFTYTPDLGYTWAPSQTSYDVTWTYQASGPYGQTQTAKVTITVHRVICSGETVSDPGETVVSGSFTLLADGMCKPAPRVDASDGDQSVTFTPGDGDKAFFRGLLSFDPQALSPGGTFTLGLQYDPVNDGNYRTLQVCLSPLFDGSGLLTSAVLPDEETWCLGGETSQASSTPGEIVTVYQVYGKEDPAFSTR